MPRIATRRTRHEEEVLSLNECGKRLVYFRMLLGHARQTKTYAPVIQGAREFARTAAGATAGTCARPWPRRKNEWTKRGESAVESHHPWGKRPQTAYSQRANRGLAICEGGRRIGWNVEFRECEETHATGKVPETRVFSVPVKRRNPDALQAKRGGPQLSTVRLVTASRDPSKGKLCAISSYAHLRREPKDAGTVIAVGPLRQAQA